jgi:hypothetical protein
MLEKTHSSICYLLSFEKTEWESCYSRGMEVQEASKCGLDDEGMKVVQGFPRVWQKNSLEPKNANERICVFSVW